MNPWIGLGIFLLGAGAGAILSSIAYLGHVDNLKTNALENQGEDGLLTQLRVIARIQ